MMTAQIMTNTIAKIKLFIGQIMKILKITWWVDYEKVGEYETSAFVMGIDRRHHILYMVALVLRHKRSIHTC